MKNEVSGGKKRIGVGFLNPLEITAARGGGACNSVRGAPLTLLPCGQKQRYLEDWVLLPTLAPAGYLCASCSSSTGKDGGWVATNYTWN